MQAGCPWGCHERPRRGRGGAGGDWRGRPRDGGENHHTTARRGRESGTHSPPHGSLTAALFAQWQDWRHCHPPRRRGGPPSVRRCARQHARTRRTHRRLLDARLRRARHRATATDTGPGPHPANATTVRPRLRRSRLTCPAARLTPRPTPAPRSLSSPPRIGLHQVPVTPSRNLVDEDGFGSGTN